MKNSIEHTSFLAVNYAKALIDVVENNQSSFEQINNDFETVLEILEMSPQLKEILINPTVTTEIKLELAEEIFKKDISQIMLNFIKILIDKKRFREFSQIHCAYINKLNEINNIQPITVISAVELSDTKKAEVIRKLEQKLNKAVQPVWKLDSDVIAGLVIKINDNVIDMSIKNRLAQLKKDLTLR